jgi:hypothetical protein
MSDFNAFRDHSESDEWQSQDFQQLLDSGVRLTPPSPFAGSILSIETPNEGLSNAQSVRSADHRRPLLLRSQASVLTPGCDSQETHAEDQPSYTVEWKVKLKNRILWASTEKDVAIPPADLWRLTLKSQLDEVLCTKVPHNWCVKPEDTKVVVSVNKHAENDLVLGFNGLKIDWSIVNNQLSLWKELFLTGKTLRVILTFTYVDTGSKSTGNAIQGNKRGAVSTTDRMLGERSRYLEFQRLVTGNDQTWPDVYRTLRCPGGSCENGKHCWIDSAGVHHKLNTERLSEIVKWVEDDNELTCHADVPDDIQRKILADEEKENLDRKKRRRVTTSPNVPPININVLPGQRATVSQLQDEPSATVQSTVSPTESEIDDSGLLDISVLEYTEYQKSRVSSLSRKREIEKVGKAVENDGWDLALLCDSRHHEALYNNPDLKRGTVARYLREIRPWMKRRKLQS